ncbi:hypothetical protein [Acidovorax cavernicola]|uniref:Uncharacterized protein n=1 Tax=Acidovorax cavernicola TaxID=1675792 RepID=A0A9X8GSA3_9BURK|nr:hypothetical protein [Acidovorax cavernicola]RIX73086.1 hypothetical protein D3H34_29885 [Acidovorax cavernicola]
MPVESNSSAAHGCTPLSPEAQAAALWTFVQAKVTRFTSARALDVVKRLELGPNEDPRALAKRLVKALQDEGIKLKHTAALQAASRLGGYSSWYTNEQADTPRLHFETLSIDGLEKKQFHSWAEVVPELRAWADNLFARDLLPLHTLKLSVEDRVLRLTIPTEPGQNSPDTWAMLGIGPLTDDLNWLDGAATALEKLRRHLEENGKAVLDGYAVLQLCADAPDVGDPLLQIGASDAATSELVLAIEKDGQHIEVTRGDEVATWRMLDGFQVALPTDGTTGWLANGGRVVWTRETLKRGEFAPELNTTTLRRRECEQFLRRYNLAKRIRGAGFAHGEVDKRLDYLNGPPENYRVDPAALLRYLKAVNLTWEGYFTKYGEEYVTLSNKVPAGFLLKFFEHVTEAPATDVFVKPTLAQMQKVTAPSLLNALLPRVDSTGFAMPSNVSDVVAEQLHDLMEDFSTSLQLRANQKAHGTYDMSWGSMLRANTTAMLLKGVAELGFVMYVAVDPTVSYVTKIISTSPDGAWVFGHELFMRFLRQGEE